MFIIQPQVRLSRKSRWHQLMRSIRPLRRQKTAWPAWAALPVLSRARIMDKFKNIVNERAAILAEAISTEHGKTHDDALGEVTRGVEVVEFSTSAPLS